MNKKYLIIVNSFDRTPRIDNNKPVIFSLDDKERASQAVYHLNQFDSSVWELLEIEVNNES